QSAEVEIVAHEESATPRRLRYQVSLAVREVYDDNINLNQNNPKGDLYTVIEPSINLGIGDADNNFVNLSYTPDAYIFASHSENDAVQHIIALAGQYRFPLLSLDLTQDIQILDGTGLSSPTGTGTDFTRTNLDVAGRTRVNIYTTRINANYSLTGKTFLTGGVSYGLSDYSSLISSSVLSGNFYLNYTYSPKLTIGLGLSSGLNFVDAPSQDQTFEQINARASYELTGKVSATVSAGVEFRQISGGASDDGSPVFDGSIFYQPFDGTSLSLTFSRRTQNSATLGSEDFYSTSVIFSARQRFLQRVYVGLTVGYENSIYFSTLGGVASNRSDDYYFLQGSLDLNLTSYWVAGIFYFHREDDSSLDPFSFYDNQLGVRSSLTF
ncbi:MAG TPA: outer membrane beta-barrel protein, partial [Chthoniobacterales bacterium]